MALDGKTMEGESVLDRSWPDHLSRKRGDGKTMELKIVDMSKEGRAFLIDRVTGKKYYHNLPGGGIREEVTGDSYPMNVMGIKDIDIKTSVNFLTIGNSLDSRT